MPLGVQLVAPPRQRCAPLAHRPLARQNARNGAGAARRNAPSRRKSGARRARKRKGVMTNLITGIIGIAG